MRCDYIAEGVIKATRELNLQVPLVVRLKGTKEQEAKEQVIEVTQLRHVLTLFFYSMIRESGLKISAFDELDDAAERAVQLAI